MTTTIFTLILFAVHATIHRVLGFELDVRILKVIFGTVGLFSGSDN